MLQVQKILLLKPPQEVAFCDRADILSFFIQDRDRGVLVVLHNLQCLPKCMIVINISQFALWLQEKQNIHLSDTLLYLCLYKYIIDGLYSRLKIMISDTDDNIELTGALVDHLHIYICMGEG